MIGNEIIAPSAGMRGSGSPAGRLKSPDLEQGVCTTTRATGGKLSIITTTAREGN